MDSRRLSNIRSILIVLSVALFGTLIPGIVLYITEHIAKVFVLGVNDSLVFMILILVFTVFMKGGNKRFLIQYALPFSFGLFLQVWFLFNPRDILFALVVVLMAFVETQIHKFDKYGVGTRNDG
ncbi:MAG: hypothetical protein ACYDAS_03560 [Patescibacteria group bacterium]